MRTVLNELPEPVHDWLERRQRLGQDLYDEVWEGVYHVAPAPHPAHGDLDEQLSEILRAHAPAAGLRGSGPLNVGTPNDYRVPDRAYLRARATSTFVDSVAVVVEIVSPNDESWAKLDFYFEHGVEEVLVVDPHTHSVQWLARGPDGMARTDRSALFGLTDHELAARIDWPPLD